MSARLTHNRTLSAIIGFVSKMLSGVAANDRTFGILYRTMSEIKPYRNTTALYTKYSVWERPLREKVRETVFLEQWVREHRLERV